jgi:fucose permease
VLSLLAVAEGTLSVTASSSESTVSHQRTPALRHLTDASSVWAFILVTSLFFLWGFAYGLLDVLNKHFQKVLGITKLQSTGLQVAYFGIGYFA